jgi:hypothetical protein
MNIKKINTLLINYSAFRFKCICLLCKKMALHAIDIEQPVLLGRFAPSTLQTSDGLHKGGIGGGGSINRVARLESIERRVSCEEK